MRVLGGASWRSVKRHRSTYVLALKYQPSDAVQGHCRVHTAWRWAPNPKGVAQSKEKDQTLPTISSRHVREGLETRYLERESPTELVVVQEERPG